MKQDWTWEQVQEILTKNHSQQFETWLAAQMNCEEARRAIFPDLLFRQVQIYFVQVNEMVKDGKRDRANSTLIALGELLAWIDEFERLLTEGFLEVPALLTGIYDMCEQHEGVGFLSRVKRPCFSTLPPDKAQRALEEMEQLPPEHNLHLIYSLEVEYLLGLIHRMLFRV